MRYRALVGIKSTNSSSIANKSKKEREEYHIQLMRDLLKKWDAREKVSAYYDEFFDSDSVYYEVLRNPSSAPAGVNVDNPMEVLTAVGKRTGHVFYEEIPEHDKRYRKEKEEEYNKLKSAGEEIPAELEEAHRHCSVKPQKAPKTGVYAYSILNPDSMFISYCYPIAHPFNDCVTNLNASRLINKNYGTPHDILYAGDLDYEGTYLPEVAFRFDGEMFETDDPHEMQAFMEEKLDNKDFIALIECEA